MNGFSYTDNFTSIDQYAQSLIQSKDPDKQLEGYRILEDIKSELMLEQEEYESEFVNVADVDDLSINSVITQFEYDKLMHEYNDRTVVDDIASIAEIQAAFEKYLEYQLVDINGFDMENPLDKNTVRELVKYGAKYAFDEGFRREKQEEANINSVADRLYKEHKNISFGEARESRTKMRNGDNKITAYVREIADAAKKSLQMMNSNADNVNKASSTIDLGEATGYQMLDKYVNGFELDPTKASQLLNYMKDNDKLAEKIYELSSDSNADDMFSERTNIDDFVDGAKNVSKPMITKGMIEKAMKSNRKGD